MLDLLTIYANHPDYGWGFSIASWTPNNPEKTTSHLFGFCIYKRKIEGEALFGVIAWNFTL